MSPGEADIRPLGSPSVQLSTPTLRPLRGFTAGRSGWYASSDGACFYIRVSPTGAFSVWAGPVAGVDWLRWRGVAHGLLQQAGGVGAVREGQVLLPCPGTRTPPGESGYYMDALTGHVARWRVDPESGEFQAVDMGLARAFL